MKNSLISMAQKEMVKFENINVSGSNILVQAHLKLLIVISRNSLESPKPVKQDYFLFKFLMG